MKDIQELYDHTVEFVRTFYAAHTGDFDAEPMLLAWTRRGDAHGIDYLIIPDVDDLTEAFQVLRARNDDVELCSFFAAGWRKSLAGERVGEVVTFIVESKTEQLGGVVEVTREPDGRISLGELHTSTQVASRHTMLYTPTEH